MNLDFCHAWFCFDKFYDLATLPQTFATRYSRANLLAIMAATAVRITWADQATLVLLGALRTRESLWNTKAELIKLEM